MWVLYTRAIYDARIGSVPVPAARVLLGPVLWRGSPFHTQFLILFISDFIARLREAISPHYPLWAPRLKKANPRQTP